MDPFDTAILNILSDGKPREFQQILDSVKFSHNTLRHHLDSLFDKRLITKEKKPVKCRGRPRFVYSILLGTGKKTAMLPSSMIGMVSLSFSKLSRVCRFEKGGFCKKIRGPCSAQVCPQIR
jgi:predicted ArsR family transcriptional regulator